LGANQHYGYNARGQVTSVTDSAISGNNRTYDYDDLGRLDYALGPWGTGTFSYDAAENLLNKTLGSVTDTITYDTATNRASQHARTGQSARAIQYNETIDRGNVSQLGGMTIAYDYSDQPVSQSGTVDAVYRYDGNKRRAYQDIDGKEVYSFYSQAGALIHRHDVTNNVRTSYIDVGDDVVHLVNLVPEYTFSDNLGSPVAGTNNNPTVDWRERYQPYGENMDNPPQQDDEPGFTGHVEDEATGLTYMQARFYDPQIGRFLSIDPVEFLQDHPASFNRYAYAVNDPINLTDPNGECPWCIGAIVGGVVNAAVQLASGEKFDYSELAVSIAAGAAGGGAAQVVKNLVTEIGLTGAGAFAANVAGNAVAGGAVAVEATIVNGVIDTLDGTGSGISIETIIDSGESGIYAGGLGATFGEIAEPLVEGSKYFGEPGSLTAAGKALLDAGGEAISNVIESVPEILEEDGRRQ